MCFDDDSHPPIPLSENSGARGEDITLTAEDGARIAAYLASPQGTFESQVIILPDIRGLHTFYKELALRFADIGIRALAIDYFARTAENNDRSEPFEFRPHVEAMTQQTFGQDVRAAVQEVRTGDGRDASIFTVGFCMGGNLSFWTGTQNLDLAGVIGFYASLSRTMGAVTPALDFAPRIQCPVLGLFGGADQGIPVEQVEQFERELNQAGVPNEIVIYPGAPHSFFDRRQADFAAASADAWNRIQGFIAGHSTARV